jgi:ribose transport system substrate-binding protein
MSFSRRIRIIAVALAIPLALAGCSAPLTAASDGSSGSLDEKTTVLANVASLTNEYFQLWDRGGSEAAPVFNAEWRMQSYDGSSPTQINQMRSAGSAGVDQVITFPINNDAVREMGSILQGSGIQWGSSFAATAWMVPSEEGFGGDYTTLNMPMETAGTKAVTESVFESIGGSGNVIYLSGAPGNRTSILREAGFDQAVANYPGIKVLEKPSGGEIGPASREVMQAMLSKYDNIDAVIAHNSASALGAVSVLEEAGNTDIKVGGTDETKQMLDKLINGQNVVAVQSIFGTWLAGYLVARNYDVQQGVEFDPLEKMMFQDSVVIDTKEAAAEYLKIENAEVTGFDWAKMSRAMHPDDWETQVGATPIDPTPFFEVDLDTPRPDGYEYPAELQESLDAGNLKKLTAEYAGRVGKNPYASAIRLTTTGQTVMGIKQ